MILAFGILALFFTLSALFSILLLSIAAKGLFKYVPGILSIAIILVYILGEIRSQHSVEILYFRVALLGACLLPSLNERLKND